MIYLDNAATTFPKPQSVNDEVYKCMTTYAANPGRSGHTMAMEAARVIYETRESVAKLLNVEDPLNIIFTFNATDSLNLGIKGYLKRGDHVVTTGIEHNSVIRPIKELEHFGVENTVVSCNELGELNYDELEASIKGNTKLVVVTHASNIVGTLVDLERVSKICQDKGITFMVDASQTLGVYDIDVEALKIDMLAAPGHKCLYGPQGTGILYLREGINLKEMKQGGTGSKSEEIVQPDLTPDKYESGTHNTPGLAGLGKGVEFILETTTKKIREHEQELTQYFIDELEKIEHVQIYGPRDAKKRAAVVSINIDDMDSGEVTFLLNRDYNIATRSGIHCSPLGHTSIGTIKKGAVRFSIGYFNTKDDIDAALKAVRELASQQA